MNLRLRQAAPADAQAAAPLIAQAIGDIAQHMTGETEQEAVLQGLAALVEGNNTRHSYRYTHIAERDGEVAGVLVLYFGADALELDQNLQAALLKKGYRLPIEPEAYSDEWYIDTVSVNPGFQGQGIGTKLLEYAEKKAIEAGGSKLSLNVEVEKEGAIRLYERLGFRTVEPWSIIGEPFLHMVKPLK